MTCYKIRNVAYKSAYQILKTDKFILLKYAGCLYAKTQYHEISKEWRE